MSTNKIQLENYTATLVGATPNFQNLSVSSRHETMSGLMKAKENPFAKTKIPQRSFKDELENLNRMEEDSKTSSAVKRKSAQSTKDSETVESTLYMKNKMLFKKMKETLSSNNLNTNSFFSAYEARTLSILTDFPLLENPIKSMILEIRFDKTSGGKVLDKKIRQNFFDQLNKVFYKDLKRDYYTFVNSVLHPSSVSSMNLKTEIKNKDYLFNIQKEDPDYLSIKSIEFFNGMTDIYNRYSGGQLDSFYVVNPNFSVYFTSNKQGKKVCYVGEYYKKLEESLNDLGIKFDKVKSELLIDRIKKREIKEKKEVSMTLLNKDQSDEEIMRFFADSKIDYLDDNMTSLLRIKGVNMTMLFNAMLNEYSSKHILIYSNSQFKQATYNECSLLRSPEITESFYKMRVYGCLFPSEVQSIVEAVHLLFKKNKMFEIEATYNFEFDYLDRLSQFFILNKDVYSSVKKVSCEDVNRYLTAFL